jgi:hypothetical protein
VSDCTTVEDPSLVKPPNRTRSPQAGSKPIWASLRNDGLEAGVCSLQVEPSQVQVCSTVPDVGSIDPTRTSWVVDGSYPRSATPLMSGGL